jgi:CBS domain-containing protein
MPRLIQLRNIKAKDIMSERLIICQRHEKLSEVLGRMKKMDIHELPVVEGGKLLGMVSYDMFIKRKSLPLTTMVENLMVTPPKVDVNDSITRVAEVMLVNNFRAVPVTSSGEIAGIVAREDIVHRLHGFQQLDQIDVKDVMSPDPITVTESDDVEKARSIMRDLDVRTIPVVDKEGKLTGVLGVKDIMDFYSKERGQRRSAAGSPGGTVDLSITVGSLMNAPAVVTDLESQIDNVVTLMSDSHISSVVVTDKGNPPTSTTRCTASSSDGCRRSPPSPCPSCSCSTSQSTTIRPNLAISPLGLASRPTRACSSPRARITTSSGHWTWSSTTSRNKSSRRRRSTPTGCRCGPQRSQ